MARNPDARRLQSIFQVVCDYPGEKPADIARLLKLHRSQVTRLLPALEESGWLLSEDERGGLWPFRKPES